ncbi:hypothetical protein [Amycolatopsis sp. CA-230715]|uniref:hypothetical protein n=1 Tax=Amycolatopsis sp. CA-230715 TaxID=2745196 RepID=UPI001C00FC16|nr:hypothetical protein [Amycolatopsis sp. CA-230715]QWF81206.1 hypothetical protein HUW46_04632 [Amycolatopsis sp. CA-230715]
MSRRAVVTTCFALAFATTVPATASAADQLHRLSLSPGVNLPYYATHPLTGSPDPTGAVIVIHGTGRNAKGYFDRMSEAAREYGSKAEVVAPWFQTEEENPEKGDAYWTNGGSGSWKDGGGAESPEGLSSFEAVDHVVRVLADKAKFPNLKRITIAGHSAGGQFTQRYAAGGKAPAEVNGVEITYVAANPSSYLYFDEKRPAAHDSCPGFNRYKYGLENRNAYMSALNDDRLRAQYTARKVTYLLGEDDVHQDHGIDDSCEAKAQGENRFERGKAYSTTIHHDFPSAPHELSTVPGVGHDSDAMFNSANGKAAVFRGW